MESLQTLTIFFALALVLVFYFKYQGSKKPTFSKLGKELMEKNIHSRFPIL